MKQLSRAVLYILLVGGAFSYLLATHTAQSASTSSAAVVKNVTTNATEDPVAAYRLGQYEDALKIFEPRAEKGDPTAQYYLGGMYYHGQGVTKNYLKAYMWMALAKDGGSYPANDSLKLIESKMSSSEILKSKEMVKQWKLAHKKSSKTN